MSAVGDTVVAVRRALVSVSDKGGLVEFGQALQAADVEILSTGGTASALHAAGVPVTEVAEHTGFPEMLDGRVKTLHPAIHGGLLGRRDSEEHVRTMAAHGIGPIDLLVVSLYPFEAAVWGGEAPAVCVENIDIGGPAMIRSAAKNHDAVTVVVDPADYDGIAAEISAKGGVTAEARQWLAAKAFARTAAYDSMVAGWLAERAGAGVGTFPWYSIGGPRQTPLRYGENPHQQAALFATGMAEPGVAHARQLQGKTLSFNNLNDADAAFRLVAEFADPAASIIKHANPAGVATALVTADAFRLALRCDPVSAFGGIVALNRRLDVETARAIAALFVEVVVAPEISAAAQAVFEEAGRSGLRLLETGGMPDPAAAAPDVRTIAGGLLVQNRDGGQIDEAELRVVTARAPSAAEMRDLLFAFKVCKHVKSNAIVYAKNGATVGVGAGQMSRVDSARVAAAKAVEAAQAAGLDGSLAAGSVVASDAFFPFPDGLLAAVEAGATAVIQPGGSVRDEEVIRTADERGLAMVFTGMRHFRH